MYAWFDSWNGLGFVLPYLQTHPTKIRPATIACSHIATVTFRKVNSLKLIESLFPAFKGRILPLERYGSSLSSVPPTKSQQFYNPNYKINKAYLTDWNQATGDFPGLKPEQGTTNPKA